MQPKKIDWSELVVDGGVKECVDSICNMVKKLTGIELTTKRDVWVCDFDERGKHDEPCTIFFYDGFTPNDWFSIADFEFEKNDKERRVFLIKVRWTDFLWSLNDDINAKIDFIQKFDPAYNPRNYRK